MITPSKQNGLEIAEHICISVTHAIREFPKRPMPVMQQGNLSSTKKRKRKKNISKVKAVGTWSEKIVHNLLFPAK